MLKMKIKRYYVEWPDTLISYLSAWVDPLTSPWKSKA